MLADAQASQGASQGEGWREGEREYKSIRERDMLDVHTYILPHLSCPG